MNAGEYLMAHAATCYLSFRRHEGMHGSWYWVDNADVSLHHGPFRSWRGAASDAEAKGFLRPRKPDGEPGFEPGPDP